MSGLRGYDYSKVSLKKVQKDKYILSSEIEVQVEREELKTQMNNALSNNGIVYFISRKKEVCGVVIIKYEKHMALDFEIEEKTDELQDKKKQAEGFGTIVMNKAVEFEAKHQIGTEKGKQKENEKAMTANAYVLESLYLSKDLKSKAEIIEKDLLEELKEAAAYNDLGVKVIIWGENIIADKTIGKTSESAISIGMCLGMSVGMMFGVVFDNIAIGMCLGMSIGMALGAAYYGSAKKKALKEQKDEESQQVKKDEY